MMNWGKSVSSRIGTWIFCATVSELNSAPSWNMTPQYCRSARCASAPQLVTSVPSTSIRPADTGCSPTISRSRTDLPAPDPPTTPSTSPL